MNDQEPPLGPYEKGVTELIGAIVARLDERLASGKAPPGEIAAAFAERRGFTSFKPLLQSLRLLEPAQADISVALLWQLVGACYGAGQLTPHAKIVQRLRAEQASIVAAGGKRKKADAGKEALWAAIGKAAEDLGCPKPAISKEFAARIRPGVLNHLGLPKGFKGRPSIGQIKSMISARRNRLVP